MSEAAFEHEKSEHGANALMLDNIARHYGDLIILKEVNLQLRRGEMIALLGPSGSGKSSLLHIAGLLEAPSDGEVIIGGRPQKCLTRIGPGFAAMRWGSFTNSTTCCRNLRRSVMSPCRRLYRAQKKAPQKKKPSAF